MAIRCAPCQSSQRQRVKVQRPGASGCSAYSNCRPWTVGTDGILARAGAPRLRLSGARPVTIGYEKLLTAALVAELTAAGVRRVIDVRFRPQSRRPGMSKTRLGALLAEHGIAYEHRRALGTPADLRVLYRAGRLAEAHAAFATHVETRSADALDALATELGSAPPTALLCLEAEPHECHRSVLVERLRARRGGLEVVNL